jgi:predicted transposase YdaD
VASTLYQHPYEKGRLEGQLQGELRGQLQGQLQGRLLGLVEGKSELVLKQLARKFGSLPPEIRQKIAAAEPHQLDLIAEGIFDFRDLGDVLRCLA